MILKNKTKEELILGKLAEIAAPETHIAQSPGQHILHHRQALNQVIFLKNHAHTPAHLAQLSPVQGRNINAIKHNFPRGGFDQPVDAADKGAFASTGWANDSQYLGFIHSEAYFFQCSCSGGVNFREATDFKHDKLCIPGRHQPRGEVATLCLKMSVISFSFFSS